jgi:uncharacterized protein YjbJ (UPF0337 family)
MDWKQIAGDWKRFKGNVRRRWDKLTEWDLAVVDGNRDRLLGKLQERYGIAREKAEAELEQFSDDP